MTIDDLIDRLHSLEPISRNVSRSERADRAIELAHVHLPKLADFGLIEYDFGSGTVRYQPDEQIEDILDSLPEEVAPANP